MSARVFLREGLTAPRAAVEAMFEIERMGHRLRIDALHRVTLDQAPGVAVTFDQVIALRRWQSSLRLILAATATDVRPADGNKTGSSTEGRR